MSDYADGYGSDEEEEGAAAEKPPRQNFARKLTSAVRNFSLPSPEEIKVVIFIPSRCFFLNEFLNHKDTILQVESKVPSNQ